MKATETLKAAEATRRLKAAEATEALKATEITNQKYSLSSLLSLLLLSSLSVPASLRLYWADNLIHCTNCHAVRR